jgi:hypothetical protein
MGEVPRTFMYFLGWDNETFLHKSMIDNGLFI